MYRISVYIPEEFVEKIKQALFEAGAGRYQGYDHCSWQTLGAGQFRALEGSSPFIGKQGVVEIVAEYKLEMVCGDKYIKHALSALLQSHPYEEPAYEIYKIESLGELES